MHLTADFCTHYPFPIHHSPFPSPQLGMVSLADSRDLLCLKFAKKSLKVENFGRLLPISSKGHKMKTRHWYSKRYMQSAIPSMQRILNRDKQKQVEALKQISVLSPTNFAC